MNPTDPIFFHAAVQPSRPAIAYTEGIATYGMVARAANTAAANLIAMGFAKGERIAVEIRDPFLHLVIALAISRIGAVGISLATDAPVDVSKLGVVVTLVDGTNVVPRANSRTIDDQFYLNAIMTSPYANHIRGAAYAPHDMWRISFSSGSTGVPKAVGYTAEIADRRFSPFGMGDAPSLRIMTAMGFSSPWGIGAVVGILRNGGMAVFAPDAEASLDLMALYQVDELILSPQQLIGMVEVQRQARRSLPTLKNIVVGGARAPSDILVDAMRLMTPMVRVNYGASETGRVATLHATQALETPGAVGHIFPWLQADITRPDGSLVTPGEEGTLRISGPSVVTRYIDGAEDVLPNVPGEYFHTGDLAYTRDDGVLVITGRDGYRINKQGHKVAPELLEEQIARAPMVQDCCVSDFQTTSGATLVIAALVLHPDVSLDATIAYLQKDMKDAFLIDEMLKVDRIPRSPLGKVERNLARDMLKKAYAEN